MVARITGHGVCARRGESASNIKRITRQRMPCRRQVYADLVGPARCNTHVTKEGICAAFEDSYMG